MTNPETGGVIHARIPEKSQTRVIDVASDGRPAMAAIHDRSRPGSLGGFGEHQCRWRFFDPWTLLAYAAGRSASPTRSPPLRLPMLIAKSVASLDRLSGGRVNLGICTSACWDAV